MSGWRGLALVEKTRVGEKELVKLETRPSKLAKVSIVGSP